MIEMPNGQTPAPIRTPTVPLSILKSVPKRTSHRYIREKKAKAVVIRAMKQPQNKAMEGLLVLLIGDRNQGWVEEFAGSRLMQRGSF